MRAWILPLEQLVRDLLKTQKLCRTVESYWNPWRVQSEILDRPRDSKISLKRLINRIFRGLLPSINPPQEQRRATYISNFARIRQPSSLSGEGNPLPPPEVTRRSAHQHEHIGILLVRPRPDLHPRQKIRVVPNPYPDGLTPVVFSCRLNNVRIHRRP